MRPEILLQSFGDTEDAAELADVLPGEDDLRIRLQGPPQARVHGLGHGHGRHQCRPPTAAGSSSNDSRYSAYRACCSRRYGVCSAYTQSKTSVRVGSGRARQRARSCTARLSASACTPSKNAASAARSEEHTSELQSRQYLVCRLLLVKTITPTSRL